MEYSGGEMCAVVGWSERAGVRGHCAVLGAW